jgi:hypothetical protein
LVGQIRRQERRQRIQKGGRDQQLVKRCREIDSWLQPLLHQGKRQGRVALRPFRDIGVEQMEGNAAGHPFFHGH